MCCCVFFCSWMALQCIYRYCIKTAFAIIWTTYLSSFHSIIRKRTLGHVRPAKIKITLRLSAVRSESSLGAFWIAKIQTFFMRTTKIWTNCAETRANLCLRWTHTLEVRLPAHISHYPVLIVFYDNRALDFKRRLSFPWRGEVLCMCIFVNRVYMVYIHVKFKILFTVKSNV